MTAQKAVTKGFVFLSDEKYGGQFVATRSFSSQKIICHGQDALVVRREAQNKGVKHPVVFYVPEKGIVHLY